MKEITQNPAMKKLSVGIVMTLFVFCSCGPKPYYQTSEGKKKQKYYNEIQYGKNPHPKMKF